MTDISPVFSISREEFRHITNEFNSAFVDIDVFNKGFHILNDRFRSLHSFYRGVLTYRPLKWTLIRTYYLARYQYDIALNQAVDMTLKPAVDPLQLFPDEAISTGRTKHA